MKIYLTCHCLHVNNVSLANHKNYNVFLREDSWIDVEGCGQKPFITSYSVWF